MGSTYWVEKQLHLQSQGPLGEGPQVLLLQGQADLLPVGDLQTDGWPERQRQNG